MYGGPAFANIRSEREFFIDNLLVRVHFIIVMIRWTGLAPWEFEFPFPGSLASTFLSIRIFPLAGGPDAHELCGECTQMWLAGMDPRGVDEHSKSAESNGRCWYTSGALERSTCSGYTIPGRENLH